MLVVRCRQGLSERLCLCCKCPKLDLGRNFLCVFATKDVMFEILCFVRKMLTTVARSCNVNV